MSRPLKEVLEEINALSAEALAIVREAEQQAREEIEPPDYWSRMSPIRFVRVIRGEK